jgi:hypothetical protein
VRGGAWYPFDAVVPVGDDFGIEADGSRAPAI